ncbi:MAG: HAD family hydrolase, partial [Patescibacteria group bacterium]|nr:HAD family hydrolase [Patescibacteria group bacterium]
SGFDRVRLVGQAKTMLAKFSQSHPDWQMNFQLPEKEQSLEASPEPDYQKFKISFHFFSSPEELEAVSQEVSGFFPNQNILTCEEIGHNRNLPADAPVKKYCLDILPATKADAVNYLEKICGINKGLVAGDSGNDTAMLVDSQRLTAVLVGGYKTELKSAVDSKIPSLRPGKRSFQRITTASGGTKAVYIEQGERLAAESILHAAKILERAENISKIGKK